VQSRTQTGGCDLAKVGVESSNPFARSKFSTTADLERDSPGSFRLDGPASLQIKALSKRLEGNVRLRVQRAAIHLHGVGDLDGFAEIQDYDAIGHMSDDIEAVRNEQVGRVEPILQILEKFQTCSWIDTPRADTGSSQTMNSDSTAKARAMPMRCR